MRAALMFTLIQTAKLNNVDVQAWLADVLARMADTPQTKLAELLPWNSPGCPISMSRTTSCVCLELRSLPSTRVTRFPRYYEPLRHPRAPGLSLTGVRLVLSSLT